MWMQYVCLITGVAWQKEKERNRNQSQTRNSRIQEKGCSKTNMLSSKVFSVVRSNGVRLFSSSLKDISIKGFFSAKNYAIVGASVKPGTMGNIICENYKRTFKGETFYINPKGALCICP